MKSNISIILLLTLLLLVGCNDFLDKVPDNRTEIDSKTKISEILVSAYPKASYIAFCEVMSDNAQEAIEGDPDKMLDEVFKWADNYPITAEGPSLYWSNCYKAIAAANMALDAIKELPNPKECDAQKGEALIARAYSHFMLVSIYSQFYNESTASKDMGIPYVTETEKIPIANYERKTVKYVYEMIEKDLQEGLPLLRDDYKVRAYHFTKAAANAFATRFYLYQKKWAKVLEYANKDFPGNSIAVYLRPWNAKYSTMSYSDLRQAFTMADQPSNLLLGEAYSLWTRFYRYYKFGVTNSVLDEVILNPLGYVWYMGAYMSLTDGLRYYMKFNELFVKEKVSDNTGNPHIIAPLFTSDEILLNRAEAKVYLNDTIGAAEDLTLLTLSSMSGNTQSKVINLATLRAYYNTDTKNALIETILNFRRVVFLHEGLRWFDILRYQLPVTHNYVDGRTITLEPNDLRRVVQLPAEVALSGLPLNPR